MVVGRGSGGVTTLRWCPPTEPGSSTVGRSPAESNAVRGHRGETARADGADTPLDVDQLAAEQLQLDAVVLLQAGVALPAGCEEWAANESAGSRRVVRRILAAPDSAPHSATAELQRRAHQAAHSRARWRRPREPPYAVDARSAARGHWVLFTRQREGGAGQRRGPHPGRRRACAGASRPFCLRPGRRRLRAC